MDDDCNEFLLFGWNRCMWPLLPCTSANTRKERMSSPVPACKLSAFCKYDAPRQASCQIHRLYIACSWRLVEASQGIQNALPKDTSVLGGLNEATYLAQQAKAHNFNVMRLFGIADVNYNEGMPLQPSPG